MVDFISSVVVFWITLFIIYITCQAIHADFIQTVGFCALFQTIYNDIKKG